MLSLDRYATVKHPRLGQLHQRRYLPLLLAIVGWVGACLICIHIFLAYGAITIAGRDDATTLITTATKQFVSRQRANAGKHHARHQHAAGGGADASAPRTMCKADYGSAEVQSTVAILHALLVFIIPAIGTLLNHLGVRQKLCALSLTARAAHGELPLPMPILRRPTHMIIVTGMAAARAAGVESSEDDGAEDISAIKESRNKGLVTRMKQVPRTPR